MKNNSQEQQDIESVLKPMEPSDKNLITLLAELFVGLQVPLSIGALGTAREPYIELRRRMGLFGYPHPETVEVEVHRLLSTAIAEGLKHV